MKKKYILQLKTMFSKITRAHLEVEKKYVRI